MDFVDSTGAALAKKPETQFKERIVPQLEEIPKCWFFKTNQVARIGIPDIIGCVRGRFFALELKMGKEGADPSQGWVLRRIRASGGFGKVCTPHNWTTIYRQLKRL